MSEQAVQIFMSYAWKDNQIPPDDPSAKKGLVTALCEQLEFELGATNPRPVLWRDRNKMDPAEQHDPIIEEEVRKSSLFLVVLSNNWMASDYCRKELRMFRERWRELNDFDFGHRIILAHVGPVPQDERAKVFPNQLGFDFFRIDERDRIAVPFWHRGKGESLFFDRTVELGRILAKRAGAVGGPHRPAPPPPPPVDAPVVYLAKPGADMRQAYLRLYKELTDHKYKVVPPVNAEIPRDASAGAFVDDALKGVIASIHLVGNSPGRILANKETTVAMQLARAEQVLDAGKADPSTGRLQPTRFVWTPRLFEDPDGNLVERDPIDAFKTVGHLRDGDEIDGGDFEPFIVSTLQHLRKIPRPLPEPPLLGANDKVYLCHALADTLYAAKIADILKRGNIRYVMPAYFHTDDAEHKEDHKRKLSECTAVMMCWADASEGWATSHSNELADWQALGRSKQFTTRALIAGPPPHIRKDVQLLHHLFPQTEIDHVLNWTETEQPSLEAIMRILGAEAKHAQ
jgi:TIR domain